MTRRKKPPFDPETIDPSSVVGFRVVRRIGTTFEVDLHTPVPISDAVETGREIALLRARRAGLPDGTATRLAERVAEHLSESIERHLYGHSMQCMEHALPVGDTAPDDDLPF